MSDHTRLWNTTNPQPFVPHPAFWPYSGERDGPTVVDERPLTETTVERLAREFLEERGLA